MKTPGLVGEIEEELPGAGGDAYFGTAVALLLLSRIVGECRIEAFHFNPDPILNLWPKKWEPVRLQVGLIAQGGGPTTIAAAERLLNAVDPGLKSGPLPTLADEMLLAVGWGSDDNEEAKFTPKLVEQLRAVRGRNFTVHMNEYATRYGIDMVFSWVRDLGDDLPRLSHRIKRWTDVAALIAVGVNPKSPIITADLLVLANDIAVRSHDVVWKALTSPQAELRG